MDEPEPRVRLDAAQFERIRSQILRTVLAELRIRGGGDLFYGYTKSSNENYGKYEKE
jgi:hypothetical protein